MLRIRISCANPGVHFSVCSKVCTTLSRYIASLVVKKMMYEDYGKFGIYLNGYILEGSIYLPITTSNQ